MSGKICRNGIFFLIKGQNTILPACSVERVTFHSVCTSHRKYFGNLYEEILFFSLKIDYAFGVCMLV